MTDYYLRFRKSDRAQVIRLGELLGVIDAKLGDVVPKGLGAWDEVGEKYPPYREKDPKPEKVGGNADPYIHVNFRTEHDLRALAENLAQSKPELASALATIPKFFLCDQDGNVVAPAFPSRVWL